MFNTDSVIVKGYAEDDTSVKQIQINGKSVRIDVSERKIQFSEEIPLHLGNNTIVAEAWDLTGKSAINWRAIICRPYGLTTAKSVRIRYIYFWKSPYLSESELP